MFSYDPALLATVQVPPQSIADVVRMLRTIDSLCVDVDGLKWFNRLYLDVTAAVAARIDAGGFSDPAWLAELDVQFARLYFSALEGWLSGGAASGCWQIVFDGRNREALARIQFALAGVNAHINHDLPAAIAATCRVTGTAPPHGSVQYNDYTALNSTLDGLIETAKRVLRVRLPGDALPPVTHLEDTLAAWNVCAARELAWQNAEQLWNLGAMPALAAGFLQMLDGFTTVIGKALLVPVP